MYVYGAVGLCDNVCCVAAVIKDSVLTLEC